MDALYVIIWIICGIGAGFMYQQKGRDLATGLLGGLLLGPIGLVLAALTPTTRVKCPHCAELISPEARICPHCRNEVAGLLPERKESNSRLLIFAAVLLGGFGICLLVYFGPFLF